MQGMHMRGSLNFLGMRAAVGFGLSPTGVAFDAFFDTSEFSRVSGPMGAPLSTLVPELVRIG